MPGRPDPFGGMFPPSSGLLDGLRTKFPHEEEPTIKIDGPGDLVPPARPPQPMFGDDAPPRSQMTMDTRGRRGIGPVGWDHAEGNYGPSFGTLDSLQPYTGQLRGGGGAGMFASPVQGQMPPARRWTPVRKSPPEYLGQTLD